MIPNSMIPAQGWPISTPEVRVRAGAVRLRPIRRRDARHWSRLRLADRAILQRWEPTGPGDFDKANAAWMWPAICRDQRREARRGTMLPGAIELDGRLVGQLTVGTIAGGPLASAWIGYWVSSEVAGGGVASAALALGVDHCFREAGLHRLEATVRADNHASLTVLDRCGFRREGVLERYLHVEGAWRDHLLVAQTVEEQGRGAVARLLDSGVARRK